ncbi:MAG: TonB-dependent receptor [Rhodocyclaceae bacterium]|nr:TonB-dependent receptor [Rhodocyclaceae bacterium]MBX3668795.1 TonB-dependent receptor [Rhodocyclaceae bacterium]
MPPSALYRPMRPLVLALAVLIAQHTALAAENRAEAMELPTVEVVGTTPLPGLGTELRDVPANVQMYGAKDIRRQQSANLGDYLEQTPTSVTLNSAQGNPFQADVNFRGFTASPVLGTPQGLSAFIDGVRINEPFGDTVNWDLIPPSAISSLQLIPGSNPAFGLNTLGGALAVYTKSGSAYPGASLDLYGGSFGRVGTTAELGGRKDNFDYFLTANYLDDKGWAEHNPSNVQQFFAKLGWQDEKTDFDVSLTLANNALQGTQTLPLSWFDDIRQPYTYPDINRNKLSFLTAKGSHFLSDDLVLGGNAYYRKYRNDNFSSNVNDEFKVPGDPQAINDRSSIDQDGWGFGLQMTRLGKIAGMENQFTLGASADFGRARFTQESQDAMFTLSRGTQATAAFQLETDANTANSNYGLYFTDTLKLDPRWTLTLSGRYNRAHIKIEDRSGTNLDLNGSSRYMRFNPALGLNFTPSATLTSYASYNEGMRAPTPIELTCASETDPCKLPNNFLADPPLKKVVSRTLEAGARGKLRGQDDWSAAIYRTELIDDIQFISAPSGNTNAGYFKNVGRTQRQGVEFAYRARFGKFSAGMRYAFVDATYESRFDVRSPNNSSADGPDGDIHVQPGNRIPGIPRHNLKLRIDYEFDEAASLGASVNYSSAVFARGDENNRDVNGMVPAYAVVNLDGRVELSRGLELYARIANLFDRKYANFGVLGENVFANAARSFDPVNFMPEQFRGPGAPRGGWIGLRYKWL